jgi:hypothetical protein
LSQTIYKPRISGMGGKTASHASFLTSAKHAAISDTALGTSSTYSLTV